MIPIGAKCKGEIGVSEASIKEFNDGQVHEDPLLKCYMACLFREL